jgi:glutathione S-transferase
LPSDEGDSGLTEQWGSVRQIMTTLYGRRSSCNVQKAMWVLAELDVAHDHVELGGDLGGLDAPEFLAMNPQGKIPVLRDGDTVVWESDAILRYVAAQHGKGRLWPSDPSERVVVDEWLAWATTTLQPPWIELFWRAVRTPRSRQKPEIVARLTRATVDCFQTLDRHLEHHAYLAGDCFSLADIPAGMTLYRWFEMDVERPATRHVERWYDSLRERGAYQTSVCIPFDELIGKETF